MKPGQLRTLAWIISIVVASMAFVAWAELYRWRLSNLGSYQLFPLFGLLAFSLMWSHYIVAAIRTYFGLDKGTVKQYFEITSFLVLVLILLHPGLLAWQLWRDGRGLPPGSELNYVGPALRWVVLLGMLAWLVFLAYELRRWLSNKAWWKYVQYLSDAAMLAIFYHGLRLGSHLRTGWFKGVWFFYGLTLIMALIYMYADKAKARPNG